ncbi:MAG: hypothetical protein IJQ73_16820 [Kiritimatiellae bacterium]|nr:hypothetical protein [Kiritimatiellia bacterium]
MKQHILIILVFAALAKCHAEPPIIDNFTSNGAISNEYAKLCTHWVLELENLLPKPPVAAMKSIKTVTCLRCKSAVNSMLNNLNYPLRPISALISDAEGTKRVKEFICDPMPFIGDFKLIGTGFPMHAFSCSIGFKFDDLKSVLSAYKKDGYYTYEAIFYTLGVNCAGRYYIHYGLNHGLPFDLFPTNNVSLPVRWDYVRGPASEEDLKRFSNSRQILFWHGADSEAYSIYTNMQSILLARFSEEQNSASGNLTDTIATMGFIRSLDAIPVLADNLTICPQASTNALGGFVFPAAEALIAIGPAIGDCFARLKATKPLSVEETLWLRISHELYPEGLEYELYCAARTNDLRAARLMQSLPWRKLSEDDMKDP